MSHLQAPYPIHAAPRPRWSLAALAGAAAAGAGVAWLLGGPPAPPAGVAAGSPLPARNAVARDVTPRGELRADERATIELFRRSAPAVVFITTSQLQQDYFTLNVSEIPRGSGSGLVWDDHGHVVTNFHVIEGSSRAEVTLHDQSSWDARVVGVAPDKDLAVLAIDAPAGRLHPLPIGSSYDLVVGQSVYAIGNPFGLDSTLTTGIISAVGREIMSMTRRPIQGVIQTDAAINPGNSGGPLLDSAGRLIGVNTAIYSPSGASAGIGFAVPVDTVNRIVPQLITHGKVVRPGLGIQIVPDATMMRLGVEGVMVAGVAPGSAAERAGLLPARRDRNRRIVFGDIIVAFDGKPVATTTDLFREIDRHEVGDVVKITVQRGRDRADIQVRLEALP